MTKKVLIINHHADTPKFGGGGRHFDLAKSLSEKGYDVTVVASSFNHFTKKYITNSEVYTDKINSNCRFVFLKTTPSYKTIFGRLINYLDFSKKVKKMYYKEYFDIVIASSVHPFVWKPGYIISKKRNCKFIVEVRDLWPLSMYEDFNNLLRPIVFFPFEKMEKKYYSLADMIITTAPYADEYIYEKYGIDKKKVRNIPHAINLEQFKINREKHSHLKFLPEETNDKFKVLYTGSLSPSEGLDVLVKSAQYLPQDITITIIGNGVELTNLEKLVKDKKLNNVCIVDKINKSYIPAALSEADLLFTGLIDREAFKYGISKNKFYDYMAAAKPIVFTSNVRGSLVDISKSGKTIPPNNPEKLAETIIEFKEMDFDEIKKYSENGYQYLLNNHLQEIITDSFIQIFNERKED